jgi:hypothetical protein
MWFRRQAWLILPITALWLASVAQVQSAEAQGIKLFTAKEAEQLRLTDEEWRPRSRSRSFAPLGGPRIVMQSPQVRETSDGYLVEAGTPTDFLIRFEETNAPVNGAQSCMLSVWRSRGAGFLLLLKSSIAVRREQSRTTVWIYASSCDHLIPIRECANLAY